MTVNCATHTNVNSDIEFERAKTRLDEIAARRFRELRAARQGGQTSEQTLLELESAYREASTRAKKLRPRDYTSIAAVLAEPRG